MIETKILVSSGFMSEAAGLVVDHLAGASIAPPNNSTGQSPVSALGLRISVVIGVCLIVSLHARLADVSCSMPQLATARWADGAHSQASWRTRSTGSPRTHAPSFFGWFSSAEAGE